MRRGEELLMALAVERAALGVGTNDRQAWVRLDDGCRLTDDVIADLTERPARPERPVNAKRLRFLARRHAAGRLPRSCSHEDAITPCDAALLATEVARIRAWADFASDLLDAHIWGFSAGDWQAAEALAHGLEGVDWPPEWKLDHDNPAGIIVDPSVWPFRSDGMQ